MTWQYARNSNNGIPTELLAYQYSDMGAESYS